MAAKTVLNYLPRESVVHKLTGTTKLAFFLLFTFASMITYNTWVLLALLAVSLCLLGMGCLACRPAGEALYGVQNMNGPSAALSILSGEAARYDAEMILREEALNDPTQPVVTLSPLTAVPDVFMDDLIVPGAEYDVRPSLAAYYGKEAILIAGEEENADE